VTHVYTHCCGGTRQYAWQHACVLSAELQAGRVGHKAGTQVSPTASLARGAAFAACRRLRCVRHTTGVTLRQTQVPGDPASPRDGAWFGEHWDWLIQTTSHTPAAATDRPPWVPYPLIALLASAPAAPASGIWPLRCSAGRMSHSAKN
jgi:hypothetical protein